MDRKAVLDKARAWSVEHEREVHAWASLRHQGGLYLSVYLYRGEGLVELLMLHSFGEGACADDVRLYAQYLNESRGLSEVGAQYLLEIYYSNGRRNDPLNGVIHLYP